MKVLIWDKELTLKNVGGPAGYLYNIHEYLKKHPDEHIDFYSDVIRSKSTTLEGKAITKSFRQRLLTFLLKRKPIAYFIDLKHFYFSRKALSAEEKEILSVYDFVHVHTLQSLVHYFLDNKTGCKVIFTTHCPEPCFDEVSASYGMKWFSLAIPNFRSYFLRRECKIIKKADLVMFPVKEALEPYMVKSVQYEKLFKEIEYKMFYVPTALYPTDRMPTTTNPLEKVGIPESSLKVCYIGRHNSIKGYDIVKEAAKLVWKEFGDDVHFVIGGKEGPLYGLPDSRWHELGWVKTIEVLNNVDIFILPNRQTYFDLILLEVLRQGTPCIISDTGGNRWFKQYQLKGVRLFDVNNLETIIPILNNLIEIKRQGGFPEVQQEICDFFTEHFAVKGYVENYLEHLSNFKN